MARIEHYLLRVTQTGPSQVNESILKACNRPTPPRVLLLNGHVVATKGEQRAEVDDELTWRQAVPLTFPHEAFIAEAVPPLGLLGEGQVLVDDGTFLTSYPCFATLCCPLPLATCHYCEHLVSDPPRPLPLPAACPQCGRVLEVSAHG